MGHRLPAIVGLTCVCLLQVSCGRSNPGPAIKNKVPLTKVSGHIVVNGMPTQGVVVKYQPETAVAETRPMYSQHFVMSGQGGLFALKTYQNSDGVPEGEYSLFMEWVPMDPEEIREIGAVDKLGGQYLPPNPPVKKFVVEKGKPLDLGTIELKTLTN